MTLQSTHLSPAHALLLRDDGTLRDDDELAEILDDLDPDELEALLRDWRFWARAEQIDPDAPHRIWALCGGRGSGKTRSGAEAVVDRCEQFAAAGAPHVGGLTNRTFTDIRALQIEGESGLAAVCERRGYTFWHPATSTECTITIGDHVSTFELRSAEEPDSLRGRNWQTWWADEVSTWPNKVDDVGNTAFTNGNLSVRALCPPGIEVRIIVTMTPRAKPDVRKILSGEHGHTVVTRMSILDNRVNLAPGFVEQMFTAYGGTRLAAQELEGMMLDSVEGALWNPALIDRWRVKSFDEVPQLGAIVVAVDPSGSESGDHAGIVVVGLDAFPVNPLSHHAFVLEDLSEQERPRTWGQTAIDAYHRWGANAIVAEVNFGAALVTDVIYLLDPNVPVHEVRASRGKRVRAEPVALLYDQGRAHHVGVLRDLEEQQCTWVPGDDSPDRMDALVWGVHHLLPEVNRPPTTQHSAADQRLPTGAEAMIHVTGSMPTGAAAFEGLR